MTSSDSTDIMNCGTCGRSQVKLRGAYQRYAEGAESVAQRGPLRDGCHLHHAERDADDRAQHQRDGDPLVVDDAVMQQGAADGQHHADFAGPDSVARACVGELIHFSDRMKRALAMR